MGRTKVITIFLILFSFRPLQSQQLKDATFSILMSGDVQSALEGGATSNQSFGQGSFGINYVSKVFDINAVWNGLSSSVATSSDFGSALLNPGGNTGGVSYTFNGIIHSFPFHNTPKLDMYGRLAVASNDWNVDTAGLNLSGLTPNNQITLISIGIGFSYRIFTYEEISANNELSLSVEAGYAYRGISGDISFSSNNALRNKAILTTTTSFSGESVGFVGKLNALKASFEFTHFGGEISGFSTWHPLVSVGVEGNVDLTNPAKSLLGID